MCTCLCAHGSSQSSEAQFFSSRGLAKCRMSRLGSSDLPRPSSTMMANTMEAKLLSSFTWKNNEGQVSIFKKYYCKLCKQAHI